MSGSGWAAIKTLIEHYDIKGRRRMDPFKVLVQTILSQNTNDRNSFRAYRSLERKFAITPEVLQNATSTSIAERIRIGGLFNIKAGRIKEVSKEMAQRFPDGMKSLNKLEDDEVRNAMVGLKGVGPKTIDIVLAFSLGRDVMPVDTHVNRVSKRLGLVTPKAGYVDVRRALESVIPVGYRVRGHMALIAHGRRTCRAINPLCGRCPVNTGCLYFRNIYKRGEVTI